ncbi:ASCH domain-containing protein [Methanobrevibacter sp. V74]|uniref:ASCH domain-containing protein n=1 Tax=Methanobrevibacter sp. V74 TaxID=3064279 RepID=UPI0027362A3E|nr:ASCH domain-containing protein [Methanobrevibacter sp. V74]
MSYKVNKPVNIIKFHKKYYLKILNKDKTQTMRLARKRLDVHENDIVTAVFPGWDKTLKIKITKIGYKQVKSINEKDAYLEGSKTKEELLNDLIGFYPNLNIWDKVYYYKFELISK